MYDENFGFRGFSPLSSTSWRPFRAIRAGGS